jgi:hypothetical protein
LGFGSEGWRQFTASPENPALLIEKYYERGFGSRLVERALRAIIGA